MIIGAIEYANAKDCNLDMGNAPIHPLYARKNWKKTGSSGDVNLPGHFNGTWAAENSYACKYTSSLPRVP